MRISDWSSDVCSSDLAWQGGSVKIASRERSARYPLDLRIGEIDDFGEFADVGIAIADEVDESLDIERERGAFERHGALVVREIIVAIDEDGAVRVAADNLGEAFGGEVGAGGVAGALDMAALGCIFQAGVGDGG